MAKTATNREKLLLSCGEILNQLNFEKPLPCHGTAKRCGKGREGIGGNRTESERSLICEGVVQLVRTPACHAGGRGVRVPSLPPFTIAKILSDGLRTFPIEFPTSRLGTDFRLADNSGSTAHAMSPAWLMGAQYSTFNPKRFAEHGKAALGRLARGLVLNHIPVLHEKPILHSNDVRGNPVRGKTNPRESPVQGRANDNGRS